MRNPLKRQPSADPKPTLRERFAAMKAKAASLGPDANQGRRAVLAGTLAAAVPLPAFAASASTSDGLAEIRARLLTAYAEARAARPILNTARFRSIEEKAGTLVIHRQHDLCAQILALPAPQTRDELALAAMAAAITWEGDTAFEPQDHAALVMIRAMLTITGAVMPPGFTGFAGDLGFREREDAIFDVPGSLPAWAIAQAEAEAEAEANAAPASSMPIA